MSETIRKNLPLLRVLATPHLRTSTKKVILTEPGVINCISECCHNILEGSVPLSPSKKQALSKYKNQVRLLALKSVPHYRKRDVIQTGGAAFLPLLLGPALGLLTQFLNG